MKHFFNFVNWKTKCLKSLKNSIPYQNYVHYFQQKKTFYRIFHISDLLLVALNFSPSSVDEVDALRILEFAQIFFFKYDQEFDEK